MMAPGFRWWGRGNVCRALLLVTLLLCAGATRPQAVGGDAAAKATLVATLARFVQWPAGTFETETSPLHVCVFASSPTVVSAFQSHQNALVGLRPLHTVVNPAVVTKNCHVLFVDNSGAMRLDRVLKGTQPAFTVGTQDGFVSEGGMVEIVHVDNALRFDFNLSALRDAGLGINPGVLRLARQVKQ